MRLIIKPWAIACLSLTALTGVGVAIAQEPAAPAPAAADPAPANEVSGAQDVSLTSAQMLEKARAYIPEMDKSRATVAEQLADAKRKRDVVKALCLDDKVKQMKLATDTAKDRVVDLTSAVSQSDPDRTKHEFTVIQVLRERVQMLVTEAQQCIGEETGFIGDTDIIVDIDPAIPDTDPSDFPDDPLVSEPPVLTSPTL
jgi:hypothetical protein